MESPTAAARGKARWVEEAKGEGSAPKGEGSAAKGEGNAANGEGSAAKGEGNAANGEGSAAKGEGNFKKVKEIKCSKGKVRLEAIFGRSDGGLFRAGVGPNRADSL